MNQKTYLCKKYTAWNDDDSAIFDADRRQHVYIIGKTGTGKTTLLKNMVVQDILNGKGVGVIDPHGDLAKDVLEHIPKSRTKDVVYFNPADTAYPVGFNPIAKVPEEKRPLVASQVVSTFKNIWGDSWGPRLEYILKNAVLALLDYERATLLGVAKLLTHERYRRQVVRRVKNPVVRMFWESEFAEYDKRFRVEAVAPIQNKIGQFMINPMLRNILGQVTSTIDFGFMMNRRRIFIANLNKGLIGEDGTRLLGSLLITKFQLTALERADQEENKREDFFLHVDEFQNFVNSGFDSILSEARKYRLNLSLCHQYIGQLSEALQNSVFGNVGTLISFRIGSSDAEHISREMDNTYPSKRFTELDKYEIYIKLMQNGEPDPPFWARALAPIEPNALQAEKIIRVSRERFARDRLTVEGKIKRWLE